MVGCSESEGRFIRIGFIKNEFISKFPHCLIISRIRRVYSSIIGLVSVITKSSQSGLQVVRCS